MPTKNAAAAWQATEPARDTDAAADGRDARWLDAEEDPPGECGEDSGGRRGPHRCSRPMARRASVHCPAKVIVPVPVPAAKTARPALPVNSPIHPALTADVRGTAASPVPESIR